MDLDFTAEQDALRDSVRNICTRYASTESVRKLENDSVGFSQEFWEKLADVGVTGMMIPEEHGGAGMTMLDSAIVYEELGRSLAPSPHFVSCVLGAGLVLAVGTPEQQSALLPQIASGRMILTPAWLEPEGGYGPEGVRVSASREGEHWVLTGVKRHVLFAAAAQQLIVLARVDDSPGDGVALFLVDVDAPGVTLTQQRSMASDAQYRVSLEEVRVTDAHVLGEPGRGWSSFSTVLHDGIILLAAQAVGGARRAHELGVDYAKTRHQFDKPLGAFQAIAHYLADRSAEVDGAQALVWVAAWNRDRGRSIDRLAPMAKLFACQTFRTASATTLQIFGGNGFTVEYDIQLYFRRAKQLELSFWDSRYLGRLVADAVLG